MKKCKDFLRARNWYLWGSGIFSFLLCLILYLSAGHMAAGQLSQQMAERWSDEKDAAQISCFLAVDAGLDTEQIEAFRHGVDDALQEATIVQDSPHAGARLWADAYSAAGKVTIVSDNGSATVQAIGAGGDFFQFHPLRLLDGAYFSESSLNQDYCILDEITAWQLFGSPYVSGKTVLIGGQPHMIAGVVKHEEGRLEAAAGLEGALVYVTYQSLQAYGSGGNINHYEIVMPNPVENYAYNYVSEKLGVSADKYEIVENTTRFELLKLFEVWKGFGTRAMNGKAIIYPYWENMARGCEDIITLLTFIALLLFLYPLILFLLFARGCWKRRTFTARGIWRCLGDKCESARERRLAKRRRRKQFKDRFDDEEELL